MYLHSMVGAARRNFRGIELGHAGRQAEVASLVLLPGRLVRHQAGVLDFGGHVRQLELDGLKLRYGPTELRSLPRVPEGGIVTGLRKPNTERGDRDAPPVQRLQELMVPLAALPKQVALRQRGVVEGQLVSIGRSPA